MTTYQQPQPFPPFQPDGASRAVQAPGVGEGGVKLVGFVTAGPGGAMTDEVGVITGDLSLATEDLGDGTAALTVQYTGAEEWYTLTGSPVPLPEAALAGLHERALDALRAGGAARVPVPAPRSEADPAAGKSSADPAAGQSSAR